MRELLIWPIAPLTSTMCTIGSGISVVTTTTYIYMGKSLMRAKTLGVLCVGGIAASLNAATWQPIPVPSWQDATIEVERTEYWYKWDNSLHDVSYNYAGGNSSTTYNDYASFYQSVLNVSSSATFNQWERSPRTTSRAQVLYTTPDLPGSGPVPLRVNLYEYSKGSKTGAEWGDARLRLWDATGGGRALLQERMIHGAGHFQVFDVPENTPLVFELYTDTDLRSGTDGEQKSVKVVGVVDYSADAVRGQSADYPVLPSGTTTGVKQFTGAVSGQWFDPAAADGYSFTMNGASLFTAIDALPQGFGDAFSITAGGTDLGTFASGESVSFGTGVSSFTITGIDPAAMLPSYSGFAVQLSFDTPTADFTMSAVPEPASMACVLLGSAAVLRRRPR